MATMPLSRYKPGQSVLMECYRFICKGVTLTGLLGQEKTDELNPNFDGSERFRWKAKTPVREFGLKSSVRCPGCSNVFVSAIIVSNGKLKKPTIFGYEAEGC